MIGILNIGQTILTGCPGSATLAEIREGARQKVKMFCTAH